MDIWFVVGLAFGVSGAAWATVIAQAVSGIGIMVYSIAKVPWLRWDRRERSTPPNGLAGGRVGRLNWRRLKEIIVNDVATGIQQSVMNFGILMIQGLVNSFGESVMASFAAAVKIDSFAYMPAQEFGNAYSLFVSQNYGAKKQERIRTGTRISFVASILFLRSPICCYLYFCRGFHAAIYRCRRNADYCRGRKIFKNRRAQCMWELEFCSCGMVISEVSISRIFH